MTYQITAQPSGHQFPVEAQESILDAALRHGYNFPYGCRNGFCGSCRGRVLEGSFEYLGDCQAAEGMMAEPEDIILCRATPTSDMEIMVQELVQTETIETRRFPCQIASMKQLSHDVMQVFLKLPERERMRFLAGQYIDVLLNDGRRRSFSLANAPHDDGCLELHIRHVPDGEFTDRVFGGLKERELLRIEGPLGSFTLREESHRPMILLAGGTGFAPIKGIIEHAIAQEITRPMYLYWGVRAQRDLYQHELAQSWAEQYAHIHYVPVLSEPAAEDEWTGRTGFVHQAALEDFADLHGYEVYAGGPPVMVHAAHNAFVEKGLDSNLFFSDAFEYAADNPKKA